MEVTNALEDELRASIRRLEASLAEANMDRRWLAEQHLKALDNIDQLARIVTAILLAQNGTISVPKIDDVCLPSPLDFSTREVATGYDIFLIPSDTHN